MLAELEELAAQLGIIDRVTFPGFVAEADKAALLSSADILALPSTGGESFGISVVEALAASTGVVIAGDNPGYRTVMNGLEGQLVIPTDHNQFAELLARWCWALQDDEYRQEVIAAQHLAAARFDVEVVGQAIESVYRRAQGAPSQNSSRRS